MADTHEMREEFMVPTAGNEDAVKERCIYPNLKLHMYTTGMRQNRLAKLVGIDEAYLSRIINGVRVPRQQMQQEIAKVLGCDAGWLFERTTIEAFRSTTGTSRAIDQQVFAED
jgi:transcriptional regulator with XRE-family HTH domain